MDKDALFTYVAVLGISLVGGVISLYEKEKLKAGIRHLFFGLMASCFVGYIAYEISFYVFSSERLSIAICAMSAWSGTGLLISLRELLLEIIKRKFG